MKVQIVIVNYRTPELVQDCLQSLLDHKIVGGDVRVSLVDNHSQDKSVELLSETIIQNNWQDWITWMPLTTNEGYAHGNNAAIRTALDQSDTPDFIWLLNPDTIVRAGALRHLVVFLAAHPEVGIVGSRLEDPDTTPQRSAFRFPTFWSEINEGLRIKYASRILNRFVVAPPVSDTAWQCDWVAGASMLVRREVFDSIGVLDENYFMYFEEVDFCRRASIANWDCWIEPASRVVHLVGQASGVTGNSAPRKRRPKYWFDSRRRYFVKNHGRLYATLADVCWTVCYASWCVRSRLQRKPRTDPPRFLLDFVRNSVLFRGFAT
ncbi:glycosyltransferase family 2 protein [Planctomycetes bacterium K23_9]|uniref:N-acetylglucosaminyl-diphospho-decaprenol L-rhamnosyltransferase n=1 Tax=Stieleria marina TaxID=1930275 RepID=A0A517NNU7_9BACT|nr:N-acetylglucosaminyl-diphospho-decaprenol L-rhamnosyltransferase [Planctomycetes bacterium K23_9]